MQAYAFPPFILSNETLQKVQEDRAILVLVTPLLQNSVMVCHTTSVVSSTTTIASFSSRSVTGPQDNVHHLIAQNKFQLVAWKVSGNPSLIREFLSSLPFPLKSTGNKELGKIASRPEGSGLAGLVNNKLIHIFFFGRCNQ